MMLCAPSSNNINEPLTVNDSEVFRVVTLNSDTFIIPQRGGEDSLSGKVNCSIPFTSPDGRACLAVGCAEGLWMGYRNDSQSLHRVLHLKMVTQCAMLEEFGILLVLANKTLFAYKVESLMPFSLQTANAFYSPQKINDSTNVQFFSVGSLGGRTLVIYMSKKGMDSVFQVLEPISAEINEGRLNPHNLQPSPLRWFRIYRDFFLTEKAHNVVFLKARISILCRKGFAVMDITDFKSVTIPQLHNPCYKKLAKRCRSSRPMGMFRSSMEEFLLCYDQFGLYVDRSGDPIPTKDTIEWGGTAEHIACHPPYVLIFNLHFIEVRRIDTGLLCQVIRGNDIRCTWNGYGSSSPQPEPDSDGTFRDAPVPRSSVCGTMHTDDGAGVVLQRVFELVPTGFHPSPETRSSCYPRNIDSDHISTAKFGQSTLSPEWDLKKADRTSSMLCKHIRSTVRWMFSLFSGRNRRSHALQRTTTSPPNPIISSSRHIGHDKTPSPYNTTSKGLAPPWNHQQLFKI